jgi:hypothetical protein
MRVQTMVNVVPIIIAHAPSLLHHNNVEVTYPGTSNLRMEPVRYVPLYFMVMPQSMVIITEVPFVTTPTHIVVNMKSKPQTPRETQLVNVHTEMLKEVDKICVG